jgi:hypothetical protein
MFIENLTEESVESFNEIIDLLLRGQKFRKMAPTLMNA